jgi:nitrogen fixation NifU-like protein
MARAFHDLVTGGPAPPPQLLGDLRLLQGVRKFPQREKCATLAWHALEQALEQNAGEATVTTEAL